MRSAILLVLGLLLVLSAFGCNRPTGDECEEACVKVKSLAKADYDKRTAELPEEMAREGWNASAAVVDELVAGCKAACMGTGDRAFATCLAGAADISAWQACLR